MTATSNIEDYALIGDSRTAALISKAGSIDWLCLPQFDSPSCFNRLLDHWRGGHFTIAPLRPFSVRRSYRDTTAVLLTEFRTDEGIVRVTDCMPVLPEVKKSTRLFPFRSVLRYIEGLEGTVELDIVFKPRPDHGRLNARLSPAWSSRLLRGSGKPAFPNGDRSLPLHPAGSVGRAGPRGGRDASCLIVRVFGRCSCSLPPTIGRGIGHRGDHPRLEPVGGRLQL